MRVFIGSSKEQERLVTWLAAFMSRKFGFKSMAWPNRKLWRGGKYTLENLRDFVDQSDAAIFFWTADDKTWYRDEERHEPRDNLVFEAGLFFAAQGRDRTQLLVADYADGDDRKVAIPSDLHGLTVSHFRWTDENPPPDLEDVADEVCKRLKELGPRRRSTLPSKLEWLQNNKNLETVTTLVGDFLTLESHAIVDLVKDTNPSKIDVAVVYHFGELQRHLDHFRNQADNRLRACFANLWDDELVNIYLRKYYNRTAAKVRESLENSIIRGMLGSGEMRFSKGKGLPSVVKVNTKPQADYEIRLTSQRLTYGYYRIDDIAFVTPLDVKTKQNPPPVTWAVARDNARKAFDYYVEDFELMFKEARRVYKS